MGKILQFRISNKNHCFESTVAFGFIRQRKLRHLVSIALKPLQNRRTLPETRVVGQVLNTGPGVVTAWLEFHCHLEGEAHWLLVLLVTHACKNTRRRFEGTSKHKVKCEVELSRYHIFTADTIPIFQPWKPASNISTLLLLNDTNFHQLFSEVLDEVKNNPILLLFRFFQCYAPISIMVRGAPILWHSLVRQNYMQIAHISIAEIIHS